MREIIIADAQGFCWGVKRALDTVEKYDQASIMGHLIHNKQVVEKLEEKGKKVIHEVQPEIKGPVVITAHGAPVEKFEQLREINAEVVDTTCPLVSVIYKKGSLLEKEGYQILIIGDKNHIEVQGIASRIKAPLIVNNKEELSQLDLPERVGVICQSTYSTKKFEEMIEILEEKVSDLKVRNTICSPTVKRQAAAEELAQKVDLMIVVGGYHSSNTKKLAKLAQEYVEAHHVEKETDLDESWFAGKKKIGITAGASTPDWVINDVKEKIASYSIN